MNEPNIQDQSPGPKTKPWIERYKASISKSLWFNTIFKEGKGAYVTDMDGKDYLALTRTNTRNLGFTHQAIISAAKEQMDLLGVGNAPGIQPNQIILAEKLKEIAPKSLSSGRVSFCNTGSDATEFVMMLAKAHRGRPLMLAHLGSHHGLSMGALALTADESENRRPALPFMPGGIAHVYFPTCYRCPFGQEYPGCDFLCIENVHTILATVAHPKEVAAFFIEPIQSKEVFIPPKEYLPAIKELCDEHQIIFVDDEVMLGFGRTGKMWSLDHFGVEPDIIYVSKSMGNGIPIAAILGTQEIMENDEHQHIVEGGAYTGNPVSCACAIAHIDTIQNDKLIPYAAEMGNYMLKGFNEFSESYDIIGDVRGKGLYIGVELVKDRKSKKPARKEARQFVVESFKRGVLTQSLGIYGNIIRMMPPLVLTKEDVDKAMIVFEEVLRLIEN